MAEASIIAFQLAEMITSIGIVIGVSVGIIVAALILKVTLNKLKEQN